MKPEDIKTFDDYREYRAEERKKRQASGKETSWEDVRQAQLEFCKKIGLTPKKLTEEDLKGTKYTTF